MITITEEKPLKHLPILDGVRGIAIIMVLFFHTAILKPRGPIDDYYFKIANSLWIGVDLFFVLSGFLITRILLSTKDSKNYFRSFYARRALRIFPLYYLFIIFSIYIVPELSYLNQFGIPNAKPEQWWYWLYGSNILSAIHGNLPHIFLGPTWSLAIEEQFYLVWPLVVALFNLRWITIISACLIILPAILRPILFHYGIWPNSIYVFTLTRIDPIATGAFIACLMYCNVSISTLRKSAYALLLALSPFLLYYFHEGMISKKVTSMIYYGYTMVALAFGCFVTLCATSKGQSIIYKILTTRLLLIAGKYSYALYLFNRPLVPIIEKSIFNPNAFILWDSRIPGQLIFTLILGASTLGLALISWNLYERWFLELKKFFLPNVKAIKSPASKPAAESKAA